jgi:membrane protease YdiL (CAAX protease family)
LNDELDIRRLIVYLAFAFGIAWVASLVVYLTGGLQDSPMLIPAANISLAVILLIGPVLWAPALGHVLTRLVTREGWRDVRLRESWPYWLAAWFAPAVLTIVGLVIYFLAFPRHYDPELTVLRGMLETLPVESGDVNLWVLVAAQVFQAVLISPFINGIATFGEEFGWRAYLQPKLMVLGPRRAMLLAGLIWGVWHWPVILMGHNYGLNYPGAPFLGPLAMLWFTLTVGTLLGWLTFKAGSVWPAVIGHAVLNGTANLGVIFVRGEPNSLLGPLPVGLVGGIAFAAVSVPMLAIPGLWQDQASA